jgi:hypothetical protein
MSCSLRSVLRVPFCLSNLPVLFCLSLFACPCCQCCPGCPVLAVLFLAVLFRHSCSDRSALAVLSCMSSSAKPRHAYMFCLSCPAFSIMPVSFRLSRPGHEACKCNMFKQHWQADFTRSMYKQHGHAAWRHAHAPLTWAYSTKIDMRHRDEHEACTCRQ